MIKYFKKGVNMRVEFKELAELQALTEQEMNQLEALFQIAYQTETELVKVFYQNPTIQTYLKTVMATKKDPNQLPYVLNPEVHKQYQNLFVREYFTSLKRKEYFHDRIKLCRLVREEKKNTQPKSMKLRKKHPETYQ